MYYIIKENNRAAINAGFFTFPHCGTHNGHNFLSCNVAFDCSLQEIHFENIMIRETWQEITFLYLCLVFLHVLVVYLGTSPTQHSKDNSFISPACSKEVQFSQTVWKVNWIYVLVMVGSGAVCMYYLHLSDVVIETQYCYESGWAPNKCVSSLLMLKSDPVCTYLPWAACCLCP